MNPEEISQEKLKADGLGTGLLRFQQVQYNVNLPVDMRFLEGQVLFG
jgi:hypothetical protein